jgi:hypothetical protein
MMKFKRQADKSYTSADSNYSIKKFPNGAWVACFKGEEIAVSFTLDGAKTKATEHAAK